MFCDCNSLFFRLVIDTTAIEYDKYSLVYLAIDVVNQSFIDIHRGSYKEVRTKES